MSASLTGPSRHCSAILTTCSSSTPWFSTSVNNWNAFSCIGWSCWENSITLLWRVCTCYWAMCFFGNLFILSTGDKAFSFTCNVFACCFSCWRYDSNAYNSGFFVRSSYVWVILELNYLYSKEKDFNRSTVLWAIASLKSFISWGVLGIMRSSRSTMHCWSYWITPSSCATFSGTHSSIWTLMTVTK